MKIVFSFENQLPCREADAEVFVQTAAALTAAGHQGSLLFPYSGDRDAAINAAIGMAVTPPLEPVKVPARPAWLRHLSMAWRLPQQPAFHNADLLYTRNLLTATIATWHRKPVLFDHYRPWGDQIPPLRALLHKLSHQSSFLGIVAHSKVAAESYVRAGVPAQKICVVHTGFAGERLHKPLDALCAREALGLPLERPTVVYTGRINEKKGLNIVLQMAALLPNVMFVLVGSYGEGTIERQAAPLPNVRIVAWQDSVETWRYQQAADVLLVPPSSAPLRLHGNTVLPLKLFGYMAAGRAILAPYQEDMREVLSHGVNAWLTPPDDPERAAAALKTLLERHNLRDQLANRARNEAMAFTWDARADRINQFINDRVLERFQAAPQAFDRRQWLHDTGRWLAQLLRTGRWALPKQPMPAGEAPPQRLAA